MKLAHPCPRYISMDTFGLCFIFFLSNNNAEKVDNKTHLAKQAVADLLDIIEAVTGHQRASRPICSQE